MTGETEGEALLGLAWTVTFKPNDGTGTMKPQDVLQGADWPLNANAFIRAGYRFNGWDTKADGSGTSYADEAEVKLTEDTTLYAQWKQIAVEAAFKDSKVGTDGVYYAGEAVEPEVVVTDKDDKKTLTKGTDYTVAYTDNVNAGKATVTVTFIGDYTGVAAKTLNFRINRKLINVTADDKTKVFGEKDPELTFVVDGLVGSDKASDAVGGSLVRVEGEDVGAYNIKIDYLKEKDNYRFSLLTGAKLTITKADAAVTTAPKARTGLEETGEAQALVEAGKAEGGTMEYSLDGKTWSKDVPTATAAGDYIVYYKVEGDGNHNDVTANTIAVTVAAPASTEPPAATATPAPTATPPPAAKPQDEGEIDTEVEKAEDVPPMKVEGLTKSVAEDLATPQELERVQAGENMVVYMTATNIDDTVSKKDKKLVTKAIAAAHSEAKVAQYLDFSMYKVVCFKGLDKRSAIRAMSRPGRWQAARRSTSERPAPRCTPWPADTRTTNATRVP